MSLDNFEEEELITLFEKWLEEYVDSNFDELYEKFMWDLENELLD